MADKFMIIIGAGLGGLSAGCYGQMNGYATKIFERQPNSGGVCVSWKRKGYVFDYAVHNLFGIVPGTSDYHIWKELGALDGLQTYSFKEFVQVETPEGKKFIVYTDLDKLQNHMNQLSPSDKHKINEFVKACRRFRGYDLFAGMTGGMGAKLRLLPVLRSVMKYSKITTEDFAKNFSDPFLQKAFATIQYDLSGVPVLIPMIFMAAMSKGDAGWPVGGSSALASNIEKSYLNLGGHISFRSRVDKILVENNKAVGVQLEDGSKHFADLIVSAADGYATIFDMLQGNYVNDSIRTYYDSYPKTMPFGLEIYYGLNQQFDGEPHALVLFQDEPITIEDREYDRLDVEVFNFDSSFAGSGKTVVKVVVDSAYDYWQNLSADKDAYNNQKKRLADQVAERLNKRFAGFKNSIEAVDVVTPVSVVHWTGGYRGFCLPWPAPEQISGEVSKNGVSKTLPGLENFYMVGQWAVGMNGLGTAAHSGRNLIKQLCKNDNKKFKTTL
ncbi:MAG: NAD(P)/FAD-dependent oxidoreductase [Candidatus Bathyarchaeota archaeon]|nr:NAD(P)/FAD-dependent oxidoreductase [Candidatus Bathyarchaeum tardum]WGM89408.1 MAG: NAD(P)/FAD-dependent oxidoreductase [Candidatus Bathyarchaeum tardum]